ncbi:hypothetical protein N0V82_008013 [Gnomoniopsis sp. IMI 355080]|nr:hypothetical protein N0V82_008013 [Gnomoniopsis sp. IMI 355080]
MAIIKELGLSVQVLVGGKPLKEYADAEPDLGDIELGHNTKVSHCYIEGRENTEFEIKAEVVQGKKPAARWIRAHSHALRVDPCCSGQATTVEELGQYIDKGPVDFDKVECADTHRIEEDKERAKHLGLLRIDVFRIRKKPTVNATKNTPTPDLEAETPEFSDGKMTLAEVALKGKAISLGAMLSSPVKESHGFVFDDNWEDYDPPTSPFAVFCFKYRTKGKKKPRSIIPSPRVPSPEPVHTTAVQESSIVSKKQGPPPKPVDDAVESLPQEEVMRLAGERLKGLPWEDVTGLFGEGLKGLPLGDIPRLAGERLGLLPFNQIRRLAGERLQENKGQDERPATIKAERQEAPPSGSSAKQPAKIKREGDQALSSGHPSKHRRTGGSKCTIDLTEDD